MRVCCPQNSGLQGNQARRSPDWWLNIRPSSNDLEAIKRRFGVKNALDYLVGEKLRMFAAAARHDAAFALELPRFLAAIWRVFNEYELAGYVGMQKPTVRRQLRALLYFS